LGDGLTPRPGEEVIDARDRLVLPGLIDLHVHVFWGRPTTESSRIPHRLAPNDHRGRRGLGGAHTFGAFRRYVIDVSATRRPFLNIGATGMVSPPWGA
jgi:dihydroorotase